MTLVRLLVLVALTFLAFRYGFVPICVTGISMLPSYRDGNDAGSVPWRPASRVAPGDVVAVETSGRQLLYLKG